MLFEYPIVKVLDWRGREEELAALANPFAQVLLAQLGILAAGSRIATLAETWRIVMRRLLRAGYTNEQSDAVLMFLERAMALPDEVEAQLEAELAEEGVTMAEMTHRWERRGWERGWERGRDEGRTEGRTEGQRDLILQLLAQQCGPLSATLTEQLGTLPEAELSELGRALLRFNNLADLEAWLAERVPASR